MLLILNKWNLSENKNNLKVHIDLIIVMDMITFNLDISVYIESSMIILSMLPF